MISSQNDDHSTLITDAIDAYDANDATFHRCSDGIFQTLKKNMTEPNFVFLLFRVCKGARDNMSVLRRLKITPMFSLQSFVWSGRDYVFSDTLYVEMLGRLRLRPSSCVCVREHDFCHNTKTWSTFLNKDFFGIQIGVWLFTVSGLLPALERSRDWLAISSLC